MNRPDDKSDERWIRPLPERVINKIAAGEVIERPAAVVKELVENSVDAGADRIEIIIEKAGDRLLKIVDNGCGIAEEQVEVAFSRHATSKIRQFDDLNELYSYGFRGEALPSIASVSRLRMVTRTRNASTGTEIIYEGGVLQSKQPIAAAPGTTIEVQNLFYNTPARRKFLKAESTESRHLSRTATGLAIGRYQIGFSYRTNNREVFNLPPNGSLHDRVAGLLGEGKKFVAVNGESGPVRVEGYIGCPDLLQNNRYGQFLFINSRYIQSPTIAHALAAGYGELIPRGRFPVGALLLTVDPHEVDVNVHPTKAEVRLSHERDIHDAVYRIVKDSLRQDGIIPSFKGAEFDSANSPKLQSSPSAQSYPARPTGIPGVASGTKANHTLLGELYRGADVDAPPTEPQIVSVDRTTGEIIQPTDQHPDEPAVDGDIGFRLVGRFADLYLLFQRQDELFIVDQHTAHERVLFEQMLVRVANSSIDGQNLLFPVQVELTPEQLALFDEAKEVMNRSGFGVSHFGGRTINIEAVPTLLSKKSPEKIFLRIIDDIASLKKAGYDLRKAMAQSLACRSAVMAGDRLNDREALGLLDSLLKCENRYSCPHGRPTFIKIGKTDLDKQFGRG